MIRAMNGRLAAARAIAALIALGGLTGCESSDSSYHYSTGYYGGGGWNDPYYYQPCCYGDVIVGRPPGYRPGDRPSNRPPSASQLPSMPSRPRPAMRGGGGGRRR